MIHVIKNFLDREVANDIADNIQRMNPDWLRTAHRFGRTNVQYNMDFISDRAKKKKFDSELASSLVGGFFTYKFKRTTPHVAGCNCFLCKFTEESLKGHIEHFIAEKMAVPSLVLGEHFISAYESGDFLSRHADKQKGGCAFVLNFTRDWRPEYGGLLHVKDEETGRYTAVVPEFNSLVIMELGDKGLDHFVSEVSEAAPHARIAITGWYSEDDDWS